MFQFKDTSQMLPSEMAAYVKDMENEIKIQAGLIKNGAKANAFVIRGSDEYKSEEEMLASLEVGEVVEALNLIRLGQTYKVKISDTRVDDYPTQIEAQHAAMLHNVSP